MINKVLNFFGFSRDIYFNSDVNFRIRKLNLDKNFIKKSIFSKSIIISADRVLTDFDKNIKSRSLVNSLRKKLKELDINPKYTFNFYYRDGCNVKDRIIFSYSRPIYNKNIILLPYYRDEIDLQDYLGKNIFQEDCEWEEKKDYCIWRGKTTGMNNTNRKNGRLDFIKKFKNDSEIDAGFTKLTIDYKNKENEFKRKGFIKKFLDKKELLKYKYLICLEGNDWSSQLGWALSSNSLVLCPKFSFESIIHNGLIPWKHFVPVSSDFSDLKDKILWCKKNDSECKNISERATEFMKRFHIKEREDKILKSVLNKYISNYF